MGQIIAVASIYNNNKLLGYRLLDVSSKQVKDVPVESIIKALSYHSAHIDNIALSQEGLVGSNGSLDRLTRIVNGIVVGDTPAVIVNRIGDIGFTFADFKGNIIKLKNNDAVRQANSLGLANGKLIYRKEGSIISSIQGEYPKVEVTTTTDEDRERVKNKLAVLHDIYSTVGDFFTIRKDDKIKLLNSKGQVITDGKYEALSSIDDRTAIVMQEHQKYGLLSTVDGAEIIKPTHLDIDRLGNTGDLFVVQDDEQISIWDYRGNKVSDTYTGRVASAGSYLTLFNVNKGRRIYTLINYYGEVLGIYANIYHEINNYSIVEFIASQQSDIHRYGIINSNGELVTSRRFSNIRLLNSSQRAILEAKVEGKLKYGNTSLYNMSASKEVVLEYDRIGKFVNQRAKVLKDGLVGLMDNYGSLIIPAEYRDIDLLQDNRAKAIYNDGTYEIYKI